MTKKHFDALAAALRAQKPEDTFDENRLLLIIQWRADAKVVADVCARFNPNFDRARFLAACGVEETK